MLVCLFFATHITVIRILGILHVLLMPIPTLIFLVCSVPTLPLPDLNDLWLVVNCTTQIEYCSFEIQSNHSFSTLIDSLLKVLTRRYDEVLLQPVYCCRW